MSKLVDRKLLDISESGVTIWNDNDKWALDASMIKHNNKVELRLDEFEDVELDTERNILRLKLKRNGSN